MNSDFIRAVRENVWLKAMMPETVPKEVAIVLLGTVVENGIDCFLEINKKNGFSEAESRLSLLRIRFIVDEEDLLGSEHFALSLQLGLVDEIKTTGELCGRQISGKEGLVLMAIRLCEIFPQPIGLVEKLLDILQKSFVFVGKDAEWWENTLKGHFDERKKVLTNYWGTTTSASSFQPSRPRGTDTQLVPCPQCGWEKRCDAGTKQFRCKNPKGCDFDKQFSEVVQK